MGPPMATAQTVPVDGRLPHITDVSLHGPGRMVDKVKMFKTMETTVGMGGNLP